MKILTVDQMWNEFLEYMEGKIDDAIDHMKGDVSALKISDAKITKLLRLASCNAAPYGEKFNAAKMAFKYMVHHVSAN